MTEKLEATISVKQVLRQWLIDNDCNGFIHTEHGSGAACFCLGDDLFHSCKGGPDTRIALVCCPVRFCAHLEIRERT